MEEEKNSGHVLTICQVVFFFLSPKGRKMDFGSVGVISVELYCLRQNGRTKNMKEGRGNAGKQKNKERGTHLFNHAILEQIQSLLFHTESIFSLTDGNFYIYSR